MAKRMYLTEERSKVLKVVETICEIAVVAVIGLFLAQYFFFSTTTNSRSMEPTVSPDSVVFIDKTAYILKEPERFSVVAFRRSQTDESSDLLIRRIIGLPGEMVEIHKGVVYINGTQISVSEYASEITSDGIAETGIRLGEDEYFVLGDMPANSEDSRSSTIGTVKASQIVGKAWLSAQSITEVSFIR